MLGSLWTLNSGLPVVGYLDDAQYRKNLGAGHKAIDLRTLLVKIGTGGSPSGETRESIERWWPQISQACQDIAGPRWDLGAVVVAPMFLWGDPGVVARKVSRGTRLPPVLGLDPSHLCRPYMEKAWPALASGEIRRERKWQLGSLVRHEPWLNMLRVDATWPIEQFGGRMKPLKSETDVIIQYARGRGVLSPPLPQNGSGWFRPRFIFAAFAGSVMLCTDEASSLGSVYRYPLNWIENMSDGQLTQLASDQRDALWPTLTGQDAFINRVNQLATHAVLNDRGGSDGR